MGIRLLSLFGPIICLLLCLVPAFGCCEGDCSFATETVPVWQRYDYQAEKMGVPVRLSFYAPSDEVATEASLAVFSRFDEINAIFSDYDPESETIRVCREGSETLRVVPVSDELYHLLSVSRHFTTLTQGAFDITVSPLVKLWRRSRSFKKLPPEDYLRDAMKLIGNDRWELLEGQVRLSVPGVRFDFGAIAKGYALDEGWAIFQQFGIRSALLDAGGDLRLGDAPPGTAGWTIGFATPAEDAQPAFCSELKNCGVASSGDTFRFVEIDGVRYSHLIDPRSGKPLTTHQVVAVIAPDATRADVMATAISILGPEEGMTLVEKEAELDQLELLIFQLVADKPEESGMVNESKKNGGKESIRVISSGRFEAMMPIVPDDSDY